MMPSIVVSWNVRWSNCTVAFADMWTSSPVPYTPLIGPASKSRWLPWWLSWLRIFLLCGRPGFDPWVGKIPWRREWLLTPGFWPGELHGLYSPWDRKDDWATFTFPSKSRAISRSLLSEGGCWYVSWSSFPLEKSGGFSCLSCLLHSVMHNFFSLFLLWGNPNTIYLSLSLEFVDRI